MLVPVSREAQSPPCLVQGANRNHVRTDQTRPSVQNIKFFRSPTSFSQPQKAKTQPRFREKNAKNDNNQLLGEKALLRPGFFA